MALSAQAALWFALFTAPIAAWVVLSDLRAMKIPNKAVIAQLLVFAIVGFAVLPLNLWAWGWVHFAVVLVFGFLLSLTGGFGAGDAKYAAAMAPFVALGDLQVFLFMLAVVTIAAFVAHRLLRRVSALRRATPHWTSWERREFPFGLALGPALLMYLILASLHGV